MLILCKNLKMFSAKIEIFAIMGKNAVNIGQNYFHNEDLSEARPTKQGQANGVPN